MASKTKYGRYTEPRAARGPDDYPTADEVRKALAAIRRTAKQSAMLAAHLDASDHLVTATELANACGHAKHKIANSQYGRLGRKLAEELAWTPPKDEHGKPIWTYALATGAVSDAGADGNAKGKPHWRWKLRPEVVEALQQ